MGIRAEGRGGGGGEGIMFSEHLLKGGLREIDL
jgi:hypothetical protein